MPGRRKFVHTLGRAFTGSLLLPLLNNIPATANTIPAFCAGMDEEEYWKSIRLQFPLNKELIFLNNATLGPSPYPVIEAEATINLELNTAGHFRNIKEDALKRMAAFVKAKMENIAFTHNVTEGINIGVWSIDLKAGDEVIISTHEHVGNALPWLNRAKLEGIVLKPIPLKATAAEMLDLVKSSITRKTRVIALPHIPCTNGQILPLQSICKLAREKGITTIIDGAHGPGLLALDLPALECDMYVSCCHKWLLGPKGTGFIYIRTESIEAAIPKFIGSFGDTGWDMLAAPPLMKGYVPTAHKFFYGTQSPGHYGGIIAAINFMETIGLNRVEHRAKELANYLQQQLLEMGKDRIEMLTPVEGISRGASIAFRVKKMSYEKVQQRLAKQQVIIRGVSENELNCLRVSTHIYNNYPELDKLIKLLKQIA